MRLSPGAHGSAAAGDAPRRPTPLRERANAVRHQTSYSEAVMRSTRFAVRGLAVVTALTLALAACDDDEVTPPPEIEVTVAPENPTMSVGDQVTFNEIEKGTTNQNVTWEANNSEVASITITKSVVHPKHACDT